MIDSSALALPRLPFPPFDSAGAALRKVFGGFARSLLGWNQIAMVPGLGYASAGSGFGNQRAWFNTGRGAGGNAPEPASPGDDPLPFYHQPIMVDEVVNLLRPSNGKVFLDVTLGGGGHSEALLQHDARVIALDQDPVAIAYATSRLRAHASRFCALRGNFRNFPELLKEIGIGQVDGILADIGVSSRQLDDASKGFSFQADGPLDLRMDPDAEVTAADLVNTLSEDELIRIFIDYGEEPFARRIARAIVSARVHKRISTTLELAGIIEKAAPRTGKRHPATLCFQALRIAVNDELAALEALLAVAPAWLKPGGRIAIISFHSLEDRIVKRRFQHLSQATLDRPEWPAPRANPDYCLTLTTRKPLEASAAEQKANPRSRSARLRVAERIVTA